MAEAKTAPTGQAEEAVQIFQRDWQVYQKVLDGDALEHRLLYARVLAEMERLRAAAGRPLRVLDLGCGDADYLCRMLKAACRGAGASELISCYTGVDLSPAALDIARANLAAALPGGAAVDLHVGDMVAFVKAAADAADAAPSGAAGAGVAASQSCDSGSGVGGGSGGGGFDVVFSSFALHHLTPDDKAAVTTAAARATARAPSGGAFLVVDTFRSEGQTREQFMAAYVPHVQHDWSRDAGLSSDQAATVLKHVTQYDFPEPVSAYERFASAAGFAQAGLAADSKAGFSKLFIATHATA